jgi:Flp pilus assembly protein TadG
MSVLRAFSKGRSEGGAALVELAVSLPVVLLVFVITIDFARVFYLSIALTNAARAGAQWGSSELARSDPAYTPSMQTVAQGAVNTPGVSAVATRLCQCATDTGTFSPTSPTANDCTSPAATACAGNHRVITVTVTTTKTFTTIMNNFPGVPNSISLSRNATLRVVE